ncbi:MAG: winged helix-turn-helix transcriptional regulator [Bacteroidales bacterium]|nr:winged helix-turn-helix transcriptional regulator [Bacteroidales bacterium]
MKSNPQITVSELAKSLGRSQDSTRYHLRQLIDNGIIKHEGSTKAGKWIVIQ